MGDALPRGIQHLKSTVPHKFTSRFSRRALPQPRWTAPQNRIERFNIREGDLVRLQVGKAKEKYINEDKPSEGFKIHTVTEVDIKNGRVYLKDVHYKKSNPIQPYPEDFDQLSTDDQNRYNSQQNYLVFSRPIHYSNVQLLVDQRPKEEGGTIFASRLTTSTPVYDKTIGHYRYDRFAAGLDIENKDRFASETLPKDPVRQLVKIPWPEIEAKKIVAPGDLDTGSYPASAKSSVFLPIEEIWEDPSIVPIGPSTRAKPLDLPRAIADRYIDESNVPAVDPETDIDTLMPLYLSEELSPRFSRAKATKGWNLRQAVEKEEKTAVARDAVRTWEESGRDTGLEEVVAEMGLGKVKIRSRTRKEVREAAETNYASDTFERGRIARMAKRAGGTFDVENDRWKVDILPHIKRRRESKMKRERRKEEKLKNLVL